MKTDSRTRKLLKFFESRKCTKIILIIFVVQAVYVALSFKFGVPPDERTHLGFIKFYAGNSLDPFINAQNSNFDVGEVTRDPSYLYHYLMSLVYRIMPFGMIAKYFVIRLFSIAFSLLSLVFWIKVLRKMKIDNFVINIGLLMVTNFSQFLMVSAAANNDPLVWLFVSVCSFFLLELHNKKSLNYFLGLASVIGFAAVTKKTFLPLGLVFAILALVLAFKNKNSIFSKESILKYQNLALGVVFCLALVLCIERIGLNLVRYRQIDPDCAKIHTVEKCRQFAIFYRNEGLSETRSQREKISFPGFVGFWYLQNIDSMVDIDTQLWSHYVRPPIVSSFALVLVSLPALFYSLKESISKKALAKNKINQQRATLFMVGLYFVVVNFVVNYRLYLKWLSLGLALHGRYVFPIIIPFVILLYWALYQKFNKNKSTFKILSICFVVLTTLSGGVSFLIRHDQFTKNTLKPVLLFDSKNAIVKAEDRPS